MENDYPNSVEDIKILFRLNPQIILDSMQHENIISNDYYASYFEFGKRLYYKLYVRGNPAITPDEAYIRWGFMENRIRKIGCFSLLYMFASDKMILAGNQPLMKIDKISQWRDLTRYIGEDILTSSFLAYEDYIHGTNRLMKESFIYPMNVSTNDRRLNGLLDRGLAENHFHLKGSAPSEHISWILLMNHPRITEYLLSDSEFRDNLVKKEIMYKGEKRETLAYYVKCASLIRILLFMINTPPSPVMW